MSKAWMDAVASTTAGDVWLFVIAMVILIGGIVWSKRND